MSHIFKTFLLWLLIAVLPVQGMAAVVKASCGLERHESIGMRAHDAAMSGQHDHDKAAADHHNEVVADTSADTSADSHHLNKSAYCSACAACCFGAAAPPPATFQAPVLASHLADALPPLLQFAGYVPARLERPPRHLSA